MLIIGIDPGLHGAVAAIASGSVLVHDMPIVRVTKGKSTKSSVNVHELSTLISNLIFSAQEEARAYVERQQAYPQQGGVSNHSIGFGFGAIQGVLAGLGIPFEIVEPRTWQRMFAIARDTKGLSCQVAQRLFPQVELFGPRGRGLDGRADALLIAEYGRRLNGVS